MMPKNKIGRHMMAKLKLFVGPNHTHQAQCPIPLEALSGRPTPAGAVFVTPPGARRTERELPSPPGRAGCRPGGEPGDATSAAASSEA